MNTKIIWGHTPRPWGYEVRVDYEDEYGIYHEVFSWPSEPTTQQIADRAEAKRVELESRMATERAEQEFDQIVGSV